MKKLFVLSIALLVACSAGMAQSIFIVTDSPDLEAEGAGNLGDFLRGLGYDVTVDEGEADGDDTVSKYRGELTADEIANLESHDLVIIHRATSSGAFDGDPGSDGGIVLEQWNNLEVSILCGSAYLPRSSRWFWADTGNERTAATGVDIVEADHPIVAGLSGEFFTTELEIDHLGEGDFGEATIVATLTTEEGVAGAAIAVWEGADAYAEASPYSHMYPRVFLPIFRYHEDDAGGTFADYSDNGLSIIEQAVAYTLTLEPYSEAEGWSVMK